MELIKQIKEAENKAKELVEDAQKYVVQTAENIKKEHTEQLEQAYQQRKEAIEKAKNQGRAAGQQQTKELMEKAKQQQQQLKSTAEKRRNPVADKIVDFLLNRLTEKPQ
jgi:vacuolar-type H+-ATPase subunit H